MRLTEITRPDFAPSCKRYASNSIDQDWALVAPLMPPKSKSRASAPDQQARCVGCDPLYFVDRMPIEHAIVLEPVAHKARFFRISRHSRRNIIISAGCATAGVLVILNDALVGALGFLAGRDATPNTGIIDGQSVKTIERRPPSVSGFVPIGSPLVGQTDFHLA